MGWTLVGAVALGVDARTLLVVVPSLAFVGVATGLWLTWRSPRRRIRRALSDCRCPDCGTLIDAVSEGVAGFGPASCPSCGVSWPLVPAPRPDDHRTNPVVIERR